MSTHRKGKHLRFPDVPLAIDPPKSQIANVKIAHQPLGVRKSPLSTLESPPSRKDNDPMFIPPRFLRTLPAIAALILALTTGYLAGRIVSCEVTLERPPIVLRHSTGALVPTVVIEEMTKQELKGRVLGGSRLIIGKRIIVPDGGGAFRIAIGTSIWLPSVVAAPEGMHFVASKRGKKYYSISDPAGAGLSAANRIYFTTAQEAEKAGYRK